jgi:hypothetical protein
VVHRCVIININFGCFFEDILRQFIEIQNGQNFIIKELSSVLNRLNFQLKQRKSIIFENRFVKSTLLGNRF